MPKNPFLPKKRGNMAIHIGRAAPLKNAGDYSLGSNFGRQAWNVPIRWAFERLGQLEVLTRGYQGLSLWPLGRQGPLQGGIFPKGAVWPSAPKQRASAPGTQNGATAIKNRCGAPRGYNLAQCFR